MKDAKKDSKKDLTMLPVAPIIINASIYAISLRARRGDLISYRECDFN